MKIRDWEDYSDEAQEERLAEYNKSFDDNGYHPILGKSYDYNVCLLPHMDMFNSLFPDKARADKGMFRDKNFDKVAHKSATQEKFNLNSTLLLEPDNEEAMYMIIDIELKRSNFSKVKELQADFEKICSILCEKITSINERLKNFDTSNES